MKYYLYILISALLQAFAYGTIAKVYSGNSNFQFYLIVFTLCCAFYLGKSFRRLAVGLKGRVAQIVILNVFTGVAFLAFFYSLVFIPASVSTLMEAAVGPLVAVLASWLLLKRAVSLSDVLSAALLCGVLFSASLFILQRSGLENAHFWGAGLSLGWPLVRQRL